MNIAEIDITAYRAWKQQICDNMQKVADGCNESVEDCVLASIHVDNFIRIENLLFGTEYDKWCYRNSLINSKDL